MGVSVASFLRRVTLSSAVCLAVPYFSAFPHKERDFCKKNTEHKMCVFIFSTTFVSSISYI